MSTIAIIAMLGMAAHYLFSNYPYELVIAITFGVALGLK